MAGRGWIFSYSRDGRPLEPPHVHVRKDGSDAKIWLAPVVRVASDRRMDPRTLKMLVEIAIEHRDEFEERWHGFFPKPVSVAVDEATMSVALDDGRTITVPSARYPRSIHASQDQLTAYELSPGGIHWHGLDENLAIEGLMAARVSFRPETQRAA